MPLFSSYRTEPKQQQSQKKIIAYFTLPPNIYYAQNGDRERIKTSDTPFTSCLTQALGRPSSPPSSRIPCHHRIPTQARFEQK